MKAHHYLRIIWLIFLIPGMGQFSGAQNQTIDFYAKPVFSDTIPNNVVTVNFNLYDNIPNRISHFDISDSIEVKVLETRGGRRSDNQPIYREGSLVHLKKNGFTREEKYIDADDLTVSILVDKSGSMTRTRIDRANEAIETLLELLPDSSAYLSWFDNDVSASILVTRESFKENRIGYIGDPRNKHTALYNAIYMKLQEFDSTATIINTANPRNEPSYKRETSISERQTAQNYIIVLTDGDNDVRRIPKYQNQNAYPDFHIVGKGELLGQLRRSSQSYNTRVFTIAIVDKDDTVNPISDTITLQQICQASNNREGYFTGGSDDITEIFGTSVYGLVTPDFALQLNYIPGTVFDGSRHTLLINLEDESQGLNAQGSVDFIMGSRIAPYIIRVDKDESRYRNLFASLGIGIILLLVALIFIHLLIPLFGNYLFNLKFITKYTPEKDEESRLCAWCGSELKSGQKVVVKCSHITHAKCWKDFDHQCPEYGLSCNEGKQYYFDINDPLSRKNARNYLSWVVNGMIAGILIWLAYELLLPLDIFNGLVGWMVDVFYNPAYAELSGSQLEIDDQAGIIFGFDKAVFISKISPMILLGVLTGFFIPLFLLILEEFQSFNLQKAGILLLRGLTGLASGFIAFFVGGIIIILFKKMGASYPVDIIPWVIFGPLLGYQLSVKTTIMAKHGILGGLISIIFSFLILYIVSDAEKSSFVLFSIMIYGGGLGGAISTIRVVSENYFLIVVSGDTKLKDIPIHKWLKVYPDIKIGKGKICEIRMDWDNSENLDDLHMKMFMDKGKRTPVLVSESKKDSMINDRVKMIQFKEYYIYNGDTFKLGNTVFRYDERD